VNALASRLRVRPGLLVDVVVAIAFTLFCLFVTIAIASDSTDPFDAGTVALILVIGGSLAWRSRWPEAVLAVTVAGLIPYSIAEYAGGPIYLAPLVAIATIAAQGDRRRTAIASIATVAVFVVVAAVSDGANHIPYLLAFAGWVVGAAFLGTAHYNRHALLQQLEQRARDLEDSREEEARRQVAEERLRIARDLHDVIAHGIAAIHMQSAATLHVLERHPENARPALSTIKQLSKETLDELRITVDVLRGDDAAERAPRAPTPGIERLDDLVDQARRAGLSVELHCEPPVAPVPVAVDVAAYRIVQESLTNVMRHAGPGAHTVVSVERVPDAIDVEVRDDGLGAAAANGSPGHGLAGMRERAATVGGELVAGPGSHGGYCVRAHLPTVEPAANR
jgi:signal transduction histidine kinase